ncbi:MAG TPA: hypothetical protein VIU39_16465 [Anaerolineales bacterium]
MNYLMILLRLIHIVAGVFWVGGSLITMLFVGPAVAANPQAGQPILQHLMNKGRLSARLSAAAGLSVLAGLILYLLDSQWLRSPWTTSSAGIGFAIGAIFGLVGFATGIFIGRHNKGMAALGAQISGQPTAEQAARMNAMRISVARLTPITATALILAVLFMSIARYFTF